MKILKQDNQQYYGNDCMVYKSIALIESYKSYIVLCHENITGWCSNSYCNEKCFQDYNEAARYYEGFIGEKDVETN